MVRSIFKIVWAERKNNRWILLELILVFSILWFCSDYLLYSFRLYIEPNGYSIDHCYRISFDGNDRSFSTIEESDSLLFTAAIDRISRYPGVLYISASSYYPYSRNGSMLNVGLETATLSRIHTKEVDKDYFNVFNITFQAGNGYDIDNINNQTVVVAPGKGNRLLGIDAEELINLKIVEGNDKNHLRISGVTRRIKLREFTSYEPVIYTSITDLIQKRLGWWSTFCIRVDPKADKQFAERFTEAMKNQLDFGEYYFSNIESFKNIRDRYMSDTGILEQFRIIFIVVIFLLSCIFLGMIGTFWIRVKNCTEEIGIRCAMGSSKIGIKRYFITESLILVLTASIPATIIALNLHYFGIVQSMNIIPSVNRDGNMIEIWQLLGVYLLTLFIISTIVALATWYPAKRAAKIEVAEALHYE